jgi:hypothetical protein
MGQRLAHRSLATQEVVPDGQNVLAHHSQPGTFPEEVVHLLDYPAKRVLHREHVHLDVPAE